MGSAPLPKSFACVGRLKPEDRLSQVPHQIAAEEFEHSLFLRNRFRDGC
jgi:hypothetical protein